MRLSSLLSLAVAGIGCGVFVLLLIPPEQEQPLKLASSSQCLECHADVAAEWESSHHRLAYQNPEVRKLSNDFSNQECIACHAPRPVLAFEPGQRVLARQSDRGLGVDCLGCHALQEGGVATANIAFKKDAPCRPQWVPRMASVDHCAACHNQHKTVEQWRKAPAALKGDGCLHCHMPQSWRAGGRKGKSHHFAAGHDLASLQAAVTLRAQWDAKEPWVSLENSGCGHNFPTDERSRAADLQVRWQTEAQAWGPWLLVHRFRDPYRDETDLTNTQLPAGATQRFALQAPTDAAGAELRLLYRTNPFQADDLATEITRLSLQP